MAWSRPEDGPGQVTEEAALDVGLSSTLIRASMQQEFHSKSKALLSGDYPLPPLYHTRLDQRRPDQSWRSPCRMSNQRILLATSF